MRQPPVDQRRDDEERDEVEAVEDHRASCDNRSTSSSVYRASRLARDVIAVVVLDRRAAADRRGRRGSTPVRPRARRADRRRTGASAGDSGGGGAAHGPPQDADEAHAQAALARERDERRQHGPVDVRRESRRRRSGGRVDIGLCNRPQMVERERVVDARSAAPAPRRGPATRPRRPGRNARLDPGASALGAVDAIGRAVHRVPGPGRPRRDDRVQLVLALARRPRRASAGTAREPKHRIGQVRVAKEHQRPLRPDAARDDEVLEREDTSRPSRSRSAESARPARRSARAADRGRHARPSSRR